MSNKQYRDFISARDYARSLMLKSVTEWNTFRKSGSRPEDIPSDPSRIYKGAGWVSWGDWLGTGNVAPFNRQYRDFPAARECVRSLKLAGRDAWMAYATSGAKPDDIPANPASVYRDKGWLGWGDWVGTGKIANTRRQFRDFKAARDFARSLKLKSSTEWAAYASSAERPDDIPASPSAAYKGSGWVSMADWLGTGRLSPKDRRYLGFVAARDYVQSLGLKSMTEWRAYLASGARPENIPAKPERVYKDSGWAGMGDWLGTGRVANQNRRHREFAAAREFARALGLKNKDEWKAFTKSGQMPADIPCDPQDTYKNSGWLGWGDWLGTGYIAPKNRRYRDFVAAREYVRSLGLKSVTEWNAFRKSSRRPADIPSGPNRTYRDQGWVSWGDWLGTGSVAPWNRRYRDFPSARDYVHSLGLRSDKEWAAFCKSEKKPDDIPANARDVYKDAGWKSMGDWLGTGTVAPQERQYRDFRSSRRFARTLGLKNGEQWRRYAASGAKPDDIPACPDLVFKGYGWAGWGDWLGTGRIANQKRQWRSFSAAREFARSLGFSGVEQWKAYAASRERPVDIPAVPDRIYNSSGWMGWADFLGHAPNRWNKPAILAFLRALSPHLPYLTAAELMAIMRQRRMPHVQLAPDQDQTLVKRLLDICDANATVQGKAASFALLEDEVAKTLGDAVTEEEVTQEWADDFHLADYRQDDGTLAELDGAGLGDKHLVPQATNGTPNLVDGIVRALGASEETIRFLVANRVNLLLYQLLDTGDTDAIHGYLALATEPYSLEIARTFLEQYNGARTIPIPAGFSYTNGAKRVEPNLMQRLTCYKLQQGRRVGNWSGVGAGKTLSAILASRVLDCRTTLVIANNGTITGWKDQIAAFFPDSVVLDAEEVGCFTPTDDGHTYLVLNYEKFQLAHAASLADALLALAPDFIVLDEIQMVKSRASTRESRRRQVVQNLLVRATEQNPDLYVLGMSATPVINDLTELRGLLELTTGRDLSHMPTRPTTANAQAFHEELVRCGLRYQPRYALSLDVRPTAVDGASHLETLLAVDSSENLLFIEQELIKLKRDAIVALCRPGTLVYTHYVEGIAAYLKQEIEAAGWRVGLFTGP